MVFVENVCVSSNDSARFNIGSVPYITHLISGLLLDLLSFTLTQLYTNNKNLKLIIKIYVDVSRKLTSSANCTRCKSIIIVKLIKLPFPQTVAETRNI